MKDLVISLLTIWLLISVGKGLYYAEKLNMCEKTYDVYECKWIAMPMYKNRGVVEQ